MAENESQSQTNVKGGGKGKIIVTAGIVVVAAAVIGAVYFSSHKPEDDKTKETITADNVDERVEDIFEAEPDNIPKYYTATQNDVWVFTGKDCTTDNAYVENVESNETPVYFDLTLDETGEVIYSSPVLELGAKLEGFALDKPLDPGEYECTVIYNLVDEEQNVLTTVNVGITMIVKS